MTAKLFWGAPSPGLWSSTMITVTHWSRWELYVSYPCYAGRNRHLGHQILTATSSQIQPANSIPYWFSSGIFASNTNCTMLLDMFVVGTIFEQLFEWQMELSNISGDDKNIRHCTPEWPESNFFIPLASVLLLYISLSWAMVADVTLNASVFSSK